MVMDGSLKQRPEAQKPSGRGVLAMQLTPHVPLALLQRHFQNIYLFGTSPSDL